MRFRILLPLGYLICALALVFVFGGAGHGWGIQIFFYLSLPVSLIIDASNAVVLWCLVFGAAQYALLGCLVDKFLPRKKTRITAKTKEERFKS